MFTNWKEIVERDLIPGEIIRPTWFISVKWSEDINEEHLNFYQDSEGEIKSICKWKFENLPEGRWWESTSWNAMPEKLLTKDEVEIEYADKWKTQVFKQQKEK